MENKIQNNVNNILKSAKSIKASDVIIGTYIDDIEFPDNNNLFSIFYENKEKSMDNIYNIINNLPLEERFKTLDEIFSIENQAHLDQKLNGKTQENTFLIQSCELVQRLYCQIINGQINEAMCQDSENSDQVALNILNELPQTHFEKYMQDLHRIISRSQEEPPPEFFEQLYNLGIGVMQEKGLGLQPQVAELPSIYDNIQ